MRNDKLFPGALLVIIGVLFLLDKVTNLHFDWYSILSLWPVLLVIAGVNLMLAHNPAPAAVAARIIVLVGGLGFLIYSGFNHHRYANRWNYGFNFDNDRNHNDNDNDDDNDDDNNHTPSITKVETTGVYNEQYRPAIKFARLNITGGGASYVLQGVTNQLFEANTKEYNNHYVLKTSNDQDTETLNFDMGSNHHHGVIFGFGDGNKSSKAFIKLNTNPEWDIHVEAGAAKLDFDLSDFKVRRLKLEGGAASFHVKMGIPLNATNLDISTGASEVTVSVPQNAACHITTETGLSSKSISGFNNVSDNEFETPGFANAPHKMYIKLSGAVSDFKVKQY